MRATLIAAALCVATAGQVSDAAAQDRPFTFTVSTATETTQPSARIDYDVGIGEHAFQSEAANQPEQRVGVHATYGRLTFLGRVGIAEVGSAYQSSQSGEALYSVFASSHQVSVAAGGGVLHEPDGVNVLLGRVVAGRNAATWRLDGNLLFEKPLDPARDSVDLITSIGWARKLTPSVALGVEAVGEDLEGFWDATEAEGGARLLVGPSVHIAPAGERWQLIATGGPLFHPADSGRSSGAFRDLPPDTRRTTYALKASLSISLTSSR